MLAADAEAMAEALNIAAQILSEIHGIEMPSAYGPSCTSKITPESFIKKISLYISQSGVTADAALRAADAFASRFLTHYRGKVGKAPISKLLAWMVEIPPT